MSIKDWAADERPREKLLDQGAQALTDAELLAIFLRTGVKGKSAVDLAKQLLQEHGSLRKLLLANQAEFCASHGLGPAKFTQLQAVLEMAKRYLKQHLQTGNALTDASATKRYLQTQLCGYEQEVFACLFLDNHHRIIKYQELFYGTINSASVHAREIVKKTLSHNAAAIIFAHNHPSGIAEPSNADIQLTKRLVQALNLIDVRVLDHLIIGDGEITSLAEKGLM